MDRNDKNNAAMFAREVEHQGLQLQPFTLAIGQILEEKGNRYAKGGNFSPKMAELNELMFLMCHDIETVMAIPDDGWRKEIIRFAAALDDGQIEAIQKHVENEISRVNSTQTKSAGKTKAASPA